MSECGLRGVTQKNGKWQAQRKVNGKNKYLGLYETKEEAAKAYEMSVETLGSFKVPRRRKKGVHPKTSAKLLNALFEGPKTIKELSDEMGVHKETIRKPIRKMHKDGLVHISQFRISELATNQPTMVFAFGPGKDAVRVTFGEMQRKVTKIERPAYIPPRHPLMAALFGEMAA
jgi:Bacterial regulatory protein, arsR family/AP2 domain